MKINLLAALGVLMVLFAAPASAYVYYEDDAGYGPPAYVKDGYRYYYNAGYGGYVPDGSVYDYDSGSGITVTPLPSPQPARCGVFGCWDPSVF